MALLQALKRLFRPSAAPSAPPPKSSAPAWVPLLRDPKRDSARARLLIFADGPGATQVISFALPLKALRDDGALDLMVVNETDFDGLTPVAAERGVAAVFEDFNPTHVTVSRCAGLGAVGMIKACEARGLSYVMHLDDNLFAVPPELGPAKYKKYSSSERLNRLRLLCERAGKIYVSTKPLREQIAAMDFSPPVIAGDIYCAAAASMKPPHFGGAPVFGYMGTAGHADDLDMIAPAIERALAENPQATFETFGTIKAPSALKRKFGERIRERQAAGSYLEFIEAFKAMNWRCGLAPLRDTLFNACKANTKFIEYTVAGIPVVASDSEVYRSIAAGGRGALAAGTDAWAAAIGRFLADDEGAMQSVQRAQDYVSDHYDMDALVRQVVEVLELPVRR